LPVHAEMQHAILLYGHAQNNMQNALKIQHFEECEDF
jgi:hypothetical protein